MATHIDLASCAPAPCLSYSNQNKTSLENRKSKKPQVLRIIGNYSLKRIWFTIHMHKMSKLWTKTFSVKLFILPLPGVKAASSSSVTYYQGQKCADTGRREYFYYVDHQGMVSLNISRQFHYVVNFDEPKTSSSWMTPRWRTSHLASRYRLNAGTNLGIDYKCCAVLDIMNIH